MDYEGAEGEHQRDAAADGGSGGGGVRRFIPYRPNLGDKRIRRCFAWLPIWVPDYASDYNKDVCPRGENVIWLEWVTVEEQWCWRGITSPRIGWKIIREVAT